jgi:hypothetical protein
MRRLWRGVLLLAQIIPRTRSLGLFLQALKLLVLEGLGAVKRPFVRSKRGTPCPQDTQSTVSN